MFIDEEVIFATFQIKMSAIPFIGEEYFSAIGHVAPYAHVASTDDGETQHAELLLQGVVHVTQVGEASLTFIVAVSENNINGIGKMAG